MSTPKTETRWTIEGFNDRFEQIIRDNSEFTYTRAYQQAEKEHIDNFGNMRFPSYDAFRKARQKLIFGT